MMFSATFNKECRQLAKSFLSADYIRIRVGRPGSSHLNVHQQVSFVPKSMEFVSYCIYYVGYLR